MTRGEHPAGTGLLRPDGLLSSTEAAHVLDITVMDVAAMAYAGRLHPVVAVTGCRYYDPAELDRVAHGEVTDDPMRSARALVYGPLAGAALVAAAAFVIWLVLR